MRYLLTVLLTVFLMVFSNSAYSLDDQRPWSERYTVPAEAVGRLAPVDKCFYVKWKIPEMRVWENGVTPFAEHRTGFNCIGHSNSNRDVFIGVATVREQLWGRDAVIRDIGGNTVAHRVTQHNSRFYPELAPDGNPRYVVMGIAPQLGAMAGSFPGNRMVFYKLEERPASGNIPAVTRYAYVLVVLSSRCGDRCWEIAFEHLKATVAELERANGKPLLVSGL